MILIGTVLLIAVWQLFGFFVGIGIVQPFALLKAVPSVVLRGLMILPALVVFGVGLVVFLPASVAGLVAAVVIARIPARAAPAALTAQSGAESTAGPSAEHKAKSPPVLTPEQRAIALAKASEARKLRHELLCGVRAGRISVAEFLLLDDSVAKRTRIAQVLRALPGYGPAKVAALLDDAGVDSHRRVGGLGPRQRTRLVQALGGRGEGHATIT